MIREADLLVENAAQLLTLSPSPRAEMRRGSWGLSRTGPLPPKMGGSSGPVRPGRLPDRSLSPATQKRWTPPAKSSCLASSTPTPTLFSPGPGKRNSSFVFREPPTRRLRPRGRNQIHGGEDPPGEPGRTGPDWKKAPRFMLSLGTTTVEAKTGYGLSTRDEIKMLEALRDLAREHPVEIVPTFLGPMRSRRNMPGKRRTTSGWSSTR